VASTAAMPAITHVAVTVSDISMSEAWHIAVLGTEPVVDAHTGAFRHVIDRLGSTLLGLNVFDELTSTAAFSERRPGLDHVSFAVAIGTTPSVRRLRSRTPMSEQQQPTRKAP
jgi:glyoxylase I family protein